MASEWQPSYNPAVLHRVSKTLSRGLSKTRKGSPSIGLQRLVEAAKLSGFLDTIKSAVDEEEALDAAKKLTYGRKGRLGRYAATGAIGGALAPAVSLGGNLAESVAAKGLRRGAAEAVKKTFSKPSLARDVTRGALGGGVLQASREAVDLNRAKKTVDKFVEQRKQAGVEPAPQSQGIPRRRPTDAWKYDPRPAEEI